MENERRNVLYRILLPQSFPAVKATRKRIASTHPGTDGCFFRLLSANLVFVLPLGVKIYFLYLWRRNSNEKSLSKGMYGAIWEEALNRWLPGVLTKARMLTVKTKRCDPKEPVTVMPFAWRSQEWIKCDIQQKKPILLRTELGGRQSWDRSLDGLTVNWQPML